MASTAGTGTRSETRRVVYSFIHEQGMATKQDIASALSLSLPTVSKYLSHFLACGFIEKKAKLASGEHGGRSPVAYACIPHARYAIGLDINAARVSAVVITLDQEVVHRRRTVRRFERTPEYLRFLGAEVEELVRESGVDRCAILGVGIAIPGLVSARTGEVFYGKVIDVLGMSAADFGAHLEFPCHLAHDSDAAGLAEFWGRGANSNAFYISLGNSVGGSVLLGGEIYSGDGVAGEVGHLLVVPGGKRCYCGQRGCLDPYCNATVLSAMADGSVDNFFLLLDSGDAKAEAVWEKYTDILAGALHDIRTIFGCRIILGGDVGVHLAGRLAPLEAKVDALSFREDPAADYLQACRHRTESIATGAALHFVDQFRHDPGAPEVTRVVRR
ncbi:ROK family transcriptional regulator [Gephyromycinifex aptenodytis]|uniref:ROK family transcriptional regulator n=1 Tax=Gephyromycinifex aptenodytis TaxID=2716227 RepID=UPI001445528F|nr:ROK family transcriptional regulator [Gephyromycinifex aptenodytis]